MAKTIKMSLNLPPEVVGIIRQLAAKRQVTMTDVIRDAVETANFLDAAKSHSKVLLEDKKGNLRELIFR
jgi:hypothetical protein